MLNHLLFKFVLCTWFIITLSCPFVTAAQNTTQAESIQWIDIILPPFHHIPDGQWKGQGITDSITGMINAHLKDVKHSRIIITPRRLLLELKKRTHACNPSIKWTEQRSRYLYFSVPSVFVPANGIAIRKEDAQLFGKTPVSLNKLLKQSRLQLGYTADRAFGAQIDPLLKEYQDAKNTYSMAGNDSYGRLIQMMLLKRIDYVLGYALELGYIARKLNKLDQVSFLPISETTPFTVSCVACSRTEEGKRIIAGINEILLRIRSTEAYRSIVEKWLNDDFIPEYRRSYHDLFINSTSPYLSP